MSHGCGKGNPERPALSRETNDSASCMPVRPFGVFVFFTGVWIFFFAPPCSIPARSQQQAADPAFDPVGKAVPVDLQDLNIPEGNRKVSPLVSCCLRKIPQCGDKPVTVSRIEAAEHEVR